MDTICSPELANQQEVERKEQTKEIVILGAVTELTLGYGRNLFETRQGTPEYRS